MKDKRKKYGSFFVAGLLVFAMTGCSVAELGANTGDTGEATSLVLEREVTSEESSTKNTVALNEMESTDSSEGSSTQVSSDNDLFTDRDMEQTYDAEDATYYELESNQEIVIDQEGVYVFSGEVSETTIIVDADDEAKVQLVLDGVRIVNEDMPAIYVKAADKVFVTSTDSDADNYLEMSGECTEVDGSSLDAVVYAKDDLVLNGLGTIEIVSVSENGISAKDDLKITGGTLIITADTDGIEANDSIRINGGDLIIDSRKDAIHAENENDSSLGYVYINNADVFIIAEDDAIRGTSYVQIDGGRLEIETCSEGIEATYIMINDGVIYIYATDDGINATSKSDAYDVLIDVYGGTIDIVMASGDTDGFDSNGDIMIYGGTISVEANSSFDANGNIELIDGQVTINGEQVTEITSQQMGGRSNKR